MTPEGGLGAAPQAGTAGTSIRAFLTDGSLATLCAHLSELSGCAVRVRDERGMVLEPGVGPEDPGRDEAILPGDARALLVVSGEQIGMLTASGEPEAVGRVAPAMECLAHVAAELCRDVTSLRHRIADLRVLYQLNAMLVRGGAERETLEVALGSALDVLGLDAGAVMLLPEDADGLAGGQNESDLEMQASVGLSEAWLADPNPLSKGREFDRLALSGEVVAIPDLAADERVHEPDRCVREGVVAFISAGLIFGGRPLGVLRLYARAPKAFSAWDVSITRSIGQQAAAAVEQGRLLRMKARERRAQRALDVASTVQRRMLPTKLPKAPPIDLAARYRASMVLGGDFYDAFRIADGRIGVVVGDVVGKGVAAALLMSAVRATLRAHADVRHDPGEVLGLVNRAVCRDTAANEFVTVWFGVVDPESLELAWASAGHEPPIVCRLSPGGRAVAELFDRGGLVAGIEPQQTYETKRTTLRPGDALFVYTDGLTDRMNFSGERFGRERLMAAAAGALTEHHGGSAAALERQLSWYVRQFAGLAEQTDDETVVVLRVGERDRV